MICSICSPYNFSRGRMKKKSNLFARERQETRTYRSSHCCQCHVQRMSPAKLYNYRPTFKILITLEIAQEMRHKIEFLCSKTRRLTAGARSKNSAANHSTFQKTSELFSIGGGHVVPVVNNTTCFSIYKWLLFLLLFSSYFPLLSHSFLK